MMSIAEQVLQLKQDFDDVFDAGYEKGIAEGGDSWYDTFWDNYQNGGVSGEKGTNGSRQNYQGAFSREGWNDNSFKPKYNITPTTCSQMFQGCSITDLEKALQDSGVVLDTSNSTALLQMVQSSQITHLPKIDARKSTNNGYAFSVSTLKSIRELVVSETTPFSNTFASAIEHLIVTGTIGQNGFSVSTATNLDKVSIESIINALSTTTTGLSVTLSLTAVNREFETSAGANDGSTSAEWIALDNSKSNWTISLA